ncbi:MAG TPA: RHS repeat-associated core domain-containing protein, partial [Dongiaceae bacterium]|nr:RHS repeat-associated core domain-containing protein [Dongiaceae bacterium]
MSTELVTANFSNATLAQGYYKLIAADPYSPNTLTYTNTYSDISYNFYDQLGQLVATIPPEGVEKLLNGGINNYTNKLTIPYITLFTYNQKGQLLSSWNSDEGKSEFVYRRDGNIRFSQNSVQRSTGRYSYTNYDNLGRAIESGEYEPLSGGIAFNADLTQSSAMKGILENTTTTGGLTGGNRYDVVRTHYDLPDNTHGLTAYIISDDDLWTLRGAVTVTEKYSEIPNGTTDNSVGLISRTRYNYDEEGKMLWELRYITNLGYKSTDYTYDAMGRLVKKIYQKGTPTETFVHYYTYNDNQQIDSVFTNTTDNIATKQLQAHYVYGLMGEVKRMELGNGVQGLDYTYLLDGSLKAVNNSDKTADPGGDGSNGFLPDAFGMTLDYYTNDYLNTRSGVAKIKGVNAGSYGTDSYNGNIKAMTWYSSKPASVTGLDAPTTNVFKYDDHYRFTENNWGTGLNFANSPASFTATTYNKEKIVNPTNPQAAGYDSHGNILSLQRTNTTGQLVDNFTYNYKPNSNELATVVNSATGTAQTYASYSYDSLGQLIAENTEDTSKTKYLKYDVTGKVVLVARDAAFSRKVAEFVYDETGARIAKKSYNTAGQLVETTWYTGDAIYIQTTGAATPEEYAIDGGAGRIGTFYRQDNVYAYELRDQTGNVRAVVAKSGSSLEVRGYSDYYPYGMVLRSGGTDYRYGYQGAYAEKDGETDWNAFELRMYDSRIARWLTTDPAGQYYSPYIAMGNDPVNGTDPDGAYTHAGAILRWVGGGFKGSVFHQNNGYAAGQWGIETKGPSQSFYDPKSSLNGVSVSEKVDYGHIDYPEIDNAISAYDNARQLEMQTAYRSSHPWGREALGDDLVGQAFGWYAGSKTLGLIGEGVATLFGSAAKTSMTTVGRWMSKAEYEMMAKTGQMVEGAGGQTFVGKGGSSAFNAATKGSVYAEFQVPTSSLLQGGRANWFKVIGPSAGK